MSVSGVQSFVLSLTEHFGMRLHVTPDESAVQQAKGVTEACSHYTASYRFVLRQLMVFVPLQQLYTHSVLRAERARQAKHLVCDNG